MIQRLAERAVLFCKNILSGNKANTKKQSNYGKAEKYLGAGCKMILYKTAAAMPLFFFNRIFLSK